MPAYGAFTYGSTYGDELEPEAPAPVAFIPREPFVSSSLVFELTDLMGRTLAEFEDREGVEVYVARGKARTAKCTVSMDDEAIQDGKVQALATRLRVYLDGQPIVNGPVGLPAKDYTERKVTISCADPRRQLEQSYVDPPNPWSATHPALSFGSFDQGWIIWRLILHAEPSAALKALGVPSHGIGFGSVPLTLNRARSYEPGKNIGEAISELEAVINGPDVELVPVVREDGIACLLYVHRNQGTNRSGDVVFSYRTGEHNCQKFSEEADGFAVRNRFTSIGQAESREVIVPGSITSENPQGETTTREIPPPHYTAEQLFSMLRHGIWEGFEGKPDVSESPTLQAHAQGEVSKFGYPPVYIDLQPAAQQRKGEDRYGAPPVFGPNPNPSSDFAPDYWIGDTVRCMARDGRVTTDVLGRVEEATLTESDSMGTVQIDHTIAPLAQAID